MAITYEYKIANLEYTNDDSKGVVVAHYRVEAKDGDESVGAYGEVMYVSKNPNNAVRRKLEREYPDIYPTARS